MDGTIVDSTEAIVKHWYEIGKDLGVDPEVILKDSHGRRSIDTFMLYDPKLANWNCRDSYWNNDLGLTITDVSKVEGRIPYRFGQDAVEVPGARSLLDKLDNVGAPWMIGRSISLPCCVRTDRLQSQAALDLW